MKAEQRHELHTNQLAEWLETTGASLKPYARAIVGVVVALAIVLGIYAYIGMNERRTEMAAADQLLVALDSSTPRELQNTVEEYRGTQQATIAELLLAERLLDDGTNMLFINKQSGRESIFKAADLFTTVDKESRDPMMRGWAIYGLGRAHESIGDLDRARDDFQRLLKEYPNGSLVESAQSHLNRLNQSSVKEFYDWFAKQEPKPPAAEHLPGTPGMKPSFNLDEPASATQGDVKLPSALPQAPAGRTGPGPNAPGSK